MATLAPVNNDSVLHCESDPCGWHRKVEIGVVTTVHNIYPIAVQEPSGKKGESPVPGGLSHADRPF